MNNVGNVGNISDINKLATNINNRKISSNNYVKDKLRENLHTFINHESFSGILIFFCIIFAMIVANSELLFGFSSLSEIYFYIQHLEIGVFMQDEQKDTAMHGMTIIHIINDVGMSFFFLMIGLEMKRDILYGELVGFKKISFPIFGALGGIIIPIGIYLYFNHDTSLAIGFGVPMSTDTAFALGAILLLGKRVPLSLKIFLVTLAVVDDLGAILVIVFFYTQSLSAFWLIISALLIAVLVYFNYKDTYRLPAYMLVGILLWVAVFNSGIHATIAAVILAFSIPGRSNVSDKYLINLKNEVIKINTLIKNGINFFETSASQQTKLGFFKDFFRGLISFFQTTDKSPEKKFNIKEQDKRAQVLDSISKYSIYAQNHLIQMQRILNPICSYFVVPIFAFMNAGVSLDSNLDFSGHMDMVLGTVLGLVVGKPIGILVFTYISEKLNIAIKPKDLTYGHIFAIGCLAGIGFTMSIFVANLAYSDSSLVAISKLATLYASTIALTVGLVLLYLSTKPKEAEVNVSLTQVSENRV